MKLQHLTDSVLHKDTLRLALSERESTSKILHHLRENERRKLFSDHKCSSLFAYCTSVLGYSESSAMRRITAARMLKDMPELEKKIEQGSLTLTVLGQAEQFFKEQEIKKIEDKQAVLAQLEDLSKKDAEQKLFDLGKKKKKAKEKTERISSDESKVTLILSNDTQAEIEKFKALLGRNITMDELIRIMAKEAIKQVEKKKFKQTIRTTATVVTDESPPPAEVTVVIPETRSPRAATKREVYLRDRKCTKCGSLFNLNYDHRNPYALGGSNDSKNIRLLCFNCNQRARIQMRL